MQVERIIVNFNPVFGLRNRRRGLKRFSCFSRKRTDLSKKKLHGVCTLTKAYQYAKGERFLIFEPCRTLVDICIELLLIILPTQGKKHILQGLSRAGSMGFHAWQLYTALSESNSSSVFSVYQP